MKQPELIEAIAKDANITKTQAKLALESFMRNVLGAVQKDEFVILQHFGTFYKRHCEERQSRNPQTGKPIHVPAKDKLGFKVSKAAVW